MSSVLVTGGSGFIGGHVVRSFVEKGWVVKNVDIEDRSHPVDIRSNRMLRAVFRRAAPETVIHLAALASVPECEKDRRLAFEHNVAGTLNVAGLSDEFRCRLIFASTAAVYGNPVDYPTREDAALSPVNQYGVTKVAGERIVESLMRERAVVLRIFNVYGPNCHRSYVVPDTIAKLASGVDPVPMFGTGNESRDFLYVSDLVDAVTRAVEDSDLAGVFNMGSGTTIPIRDLARRISKAVGRETVSFQFEGRRRAGDFDMNWADITKARQELGWQPTVSLEEGLKTTVEEFAERPSQRSSS